MRAVLRAGLLAAAVLWVAAAWAANGIKSVPALGARVTDTTGTLTASQIAAVEQRLADFEARKGVQIGVLIVATTKPETIEQYGIRVAEQWKLGRKKVDDGALLLIAKEDRALRIEVGYGLEGALNDAVTKRIVSDVIAPRFGQGDFAGGLDAGLTAMMAVVDGEPLPAPVPAAQAQAADAQQALTALLLIAFVASAVLGALLGRTTGALAAGGVVGVAAWLLLGVVSTALLSAVLAALFTLAGGVRLLPYVLGRGGGYRGGRGAGGFRGGGGGFGGGGSSGRW